MQTLLTRIEDRAAANLSDAWRRYAQIIIRGDNSTEADADELSVLMTRLNLSPADVRRHAEIVTEAQRLAELAPQAEPLRTSAAEARQRFNDHREAMKRKVESLEQEERLLNREMLTADDQHRSAVAAGERLERVRRDHAWLFREASGDVQAVPAHPPIGPDESHFDPPAKLLTLGRDQVYDADALAMEGLPTTELRRAGLAQMPGGNLWIGAVVVEWVRAKRAANRSRTIAQLNEQLVEGVRPEMIANLSASRYDTAMLRTVHHRLPDIIRRGFDGARVLAADGDGTVPGDNLRAWVHHVCEQNAKIRRRLDALTAEAEREAYRPSTPVDGGQPAAANAATERADAKPPEPPNPATATATSRPRESIRPAHRRGRA